MDKLKELENLLQNHDWQFAWSDNHSVYMSGEREWKAIQELIQELGQEGKDLFNQYAPKSEPRMNETNQYNKIIKGMKDSKRDLVRRYGRDAEKVMYGRAEKVSEVKKLIKKIIKEELDMYTSTNTWENPKRGGKNDTEMLRSKLLQGLDNVWDDGDRDVLFELANFRGIDTQRGNGFMYYDLERAIKGMSEGQLRALENKMRKIGIIQ